MYRYQSFELIVFLLSQEPDFAHNLGCWNKTNFGLNAGLWMVTLSYLLFHQYLVIEVHHASNRLFF